ncbi:MAG TPA: hypothetical protein VFG54_18115 [Prolixibacteraceae bacterium]|nr:hypothetical protein [Prolixibacteraceae bacterium]
MRSVLFSILTFLFLASTHAQEVQKVHLDPTDHSLNYYLAMVPKDLPVKAYLFLMPSFGEIPETVLMQTDLPRLAAERGILTIIPVLKTGLRSLGVDSLSQQSLMEMAENVVQKYQLTNQHLFVGGFSIGGSCAVRFAELAVSKNFQHQPRAVFAIDPPLDFERFYHSSVRTIRLAAASQPNPEALYMKERLEKEMNGTPETALMNYRNCSPYSFSDTRQTAIKSIVNIPVRIYTEPDVSWWLKERGSDFSGMNALDASCMINELNRLGNAKANLIITHDKGYRKPDNRRHPHSWSIVDNAELINWLLEQ